MWVIFRLPTPPAPRLTGVGGTTESEVFSPLPLGEGSGVRVNISPTLHHHPFSGVLGRVMEEIRPNCAICQMKMGGDATVEVLIFRTTGTTKDLKLFSYPRASVGMSWLRGKFRTKHWRVQTAFPRWPVGMREVVVTLSILPYWWYVQTRKKCFFVPTRQYL